MARKSWSFVPLETATGKSAKFIAASESEHSTWLKLMIQCGIENSRGRITNCRGWDDQRWQQICQVTLERINMPSELWAWEGNDVVVTFWPQEAYDNLEKKREREQERRDAEKKKDQAKRAGKRGGTRGNTKAPKGSKAKVSVAKESKGKESIATAGSGVGAIASEDGEKELSRSLPLAEDDCRKLALLLDVDPDFAVDKWKLVQSRDGCDINDKPIADWGAYLLVSWGYEKERRTDRSFDRPAAEARLKEIASALRRMPQPHPDVFPAEAALASEQREKLKAEKEEIMKRLGRNQ